MLLAGSVTDHVERTWRDDILGTLDDYIAIPNLSPMFDADWAAHGHMADAVELVRSWCAGRALEGMTVDVHALPNRTPVIVCEVPAFGGDSTAGTDDAVVLYGHLDKQPPMSGWHDGLGPWTPVRRGDRLYGRGAADDGYAAFAALTALEAIQRAGGRHARSLVLIEASEESGSPDLPAHVDALAGRLGSPSLVVCLDSGCPTFDRLWATTSLRGLVGVVLTVHVLAEGVHSGSAGGVVPSSFRILRQLLSRIEDATTGELLVPELHVEIPTDRVAQMDATAAELGTLVAGVHPVVEGLELIDEGDPAVQLRNRTWRPSLAYVGGDGLPPVSTAGNVLRAASTMKLSIRLPPTADPNRAAASVVAALEADPPHGAHVTTELADVASGWNAPTFAPWLTGALDTASNAAWGKPARAMGEGGTIPFMAMLGGRFPDAQFLVTGVLGPGSNAHGPNEFLDVPYATALTGAVAHVLDAHARR